MMFSSILIVQLLVNSLNTSIFQALSYFVPNHIRAMRIESLGESIFANLAILLLSFSLSRIKRSTVILKFFSSLFSWSYLLFISSLVLKNENLFISSWYVNRALTSVPTYIRDRYLINQKSSLRLISIKSLKQMLSPLVCIVIKIIASHRENIHPYLTSLNVFSLCFAIVVFLILGCVNLILVKSSENVKCDEEELEEVESAKILKSLFFVILSILILSLSPADQIITKILPISDAAIYRSVGQILAILIRFRSVKSYLVAYYLIDVFMYILGLYIDSTTVMFYESVGMWILRRVFCVIWGVLMTMKSVLSIRILNMYAKHLSKYKIFAYYLANSIGSLLFNFVLFSYFQSFHISLVILSCLSVLSQHIILKRNREYSS